MNFYENQYTIFGLYFLLLAGALWHILGLFTTIMTIFAGPTLIILSILVFIELYIQNPQKRFIVISIIVFSVGFIAEFIGVKTGFPFGSYSYSNILKPQLFGVPLAIGCAWFLVSITSTAITNSIVKYKSVIFRSTISALFILIFDIILEPAAVKLTYWTWIDHHIPLLNYITWFVLGWIFSFLLHFLHYPTTRFSKHVYFAQLVYFVLIIFFV